MPNSPNSNQQSAVKSQTFVIQSTTENLKPIRSKIKPLLKKAGFSDKTLESILVALGEACTNAIRHSYGCEEGHEIRVTFEDHKAKIVLRIRDYGKKIDLSKVKTPTLPPVQSGGLGIYFMKTIMDELEYNTAHLRGNELVMAKSKERDPKVENTNQKK